MGVSSLGVHSLELPILDLGTHSLTGLGAQSLRVYSLRDYSLGTIFAQYSLQSRATNFKSGDARWTGSLESESRESGSLQSESLQPGIGLPISDLGTHSLTGSLQPASPVNPVCSLRVWAFTISSY